MLKHLLTSSLPVIQLQVKSTEGRRRHLDEKAVISGLFRFPQEYKKGTRSLQEKKGNIAKQLCYVGNVFMLLSAALRQNKAILKASSHKITLGTIIMQSSLRFSVFLLLYVI